MVQTSDTTDSPHLLMLPESLVRHVEREREQAAIRKRKFDAANPGKSHHKLDDSPFIFWDGEGPQDAGYALFGNSEGDELCHPFLTTAECLDLILQSGTSQPGAIHVWYGGNYDVSMILKDLSWRHLKALKDHTKVVWRGWRIEYVPRKWFSVSNGKVRVKIYDVVSFFACPFLAALESFGIGTDTEQTLIRSGKLGRSSFLWSHIKEIAEYWRMELRLGVALMNKLRQIFQTAGFNVRSWHGPGALARMALNRHRVREAMAVSPPAVRVAAMFAFAGGRFEMPRGGHIQERIYNADLRSAYPAYARRLPNLARGNWRYSRNYEADKFGIWHIDYHASTRGRGRIYPLFRRLENGEVIWPADVEGWYHAPEAELVADDPDATILEGWVFDEDDSNDRPFAWIEDYFHKRMVLKRAGNPAEFTFKLIINSVYGQLAQRTGWNKRTGEAPRFHQLEWAGYITSACRATMYTLARSCGNQLVSVDTDGIYTRCPLPVQPSTDLGGWEVNEYEGGVFWQSGIYALDTGDGWERGKIKSRGIPKGTYSADDMLSKLERNEPLTMLKKTFTGFGLALNGQYDRLNTWSEDRFTFLFGGAGKRYHNRTRCADYCDQSAGVHEFVQWPVRPGLSCPHRLPWLVPDHAGKVTHDAVVAFDLNNLDEDDRWVLDYAA